MSPSYGWSAGAIRATAEDVANFYRGLLSGKLLPSAQLAAMKATAATGGQYGLGLMPTNTKAYPSRHPAVAPGATLGSFVGYSQLPISSPDGSRQAVLMANADPTLMTHAQTVQMYELLATAYCSGVAP